ncbi:MAG: hypothetical protein AB8G15_03460 [Saprospiraceae bacterium]
MKLFLRKTQQELESTFKVSFNRDTLWENPNEDHLYSTGSLYPIITNERPVSLQLVPWGFPIYLDENQTILKTITEVGIESILEKPMFECIHRRRCLIPFETKESQTLHYGAGIWDTYSRGRRSVAKKRFTLLTTKSDISSGRTPFVLEGKAYKLWLSEGDISTAELSSLFE